MAAQPGYKTLRDHIRLIGPAVAVTLLGFLLAYQFVDPAPPERITIATGGSDGAYHLFGQHYSRVLERFGIALEVRATAGSVENLKLLSSPSSGVDVAFVQGGTAQLSPSADLLGLASLYFEPLWVFHRAGTRVAELKNFRGRRLAVGAEGSGTRAVAVTLLEDNAVNETNATLLPLSGSRAVEALESGQVDAVFLVASAQSPSVKTLLEDPGVALMSFDRAAAYTRLHRFLSSVTLPEGVVSLEKNVPGRDVVLLAPAATLVASPTLHPSLVDLLLQAAAEVHGDGGLFEQRDQFPSTRYLEFPLSSDARRYFKSGPPFLQRFLPFWAATLIDRMLVMLLPLVALAFPLFKIMPPMLRWRIRSRIYRWYRSLLTIEPALRDDSDRATLQAHATTLDRLEREVSRVEVPLAYADQLYHLRLHIKLVREKVDAALAARTD